MQHMQRMQHELGPAHRSILLRHPSQKVWPQATSMRGTTAPPYGSKQIWQLGTAGTWGENAVRTQ